MNGLGTLMSPCLKVFMDGVMCKVLAGGISWWVKLEKDGSGSLGYADGEMKEELLDIVGEIRNVYNCRKLKVNSNKRKVMVVKWNSDFEM